MIQVFSFDACPWCTKAKKYLDKKGVAYTVRDIEKDEAAREECRRLSGDTIVPVTTADGKDFAGSYDREKLDKILGITA